jgi:hypothetical protein
VSGNVIGCWRRQFRLRPEGLQRDDVVGVEVRGERGGAGGVVGRHAAAGKLVQLDEFGGHGLGGLHGVGAVEGHVGDDFLENDDGVDGEFLFRTVGGLVKACQLQVEEVIVIETAIQLLGVAEGDFVEGDGQFFGFEMAGDQPVLQRGENHGVIGFCVIEAEVGELAPVGDLIIFSAQPELEVFQFAVGPGFVYTIVRRKVCVNLPDLLAAEDGFAGGIELDRQPAVHFDDAIAIVANLQHDGENVPTGGRLTSIF